MCEHGFIGPCAVCDGCGQRPEPEIVECSTCGGCGRISDADSGEPLKCLDCNSSGEISLPG